MNIVLDKATDCKDDSDLGMVVRPSTYRPIDSLLTVRWNLRGKTMSCHDLTTYESF